MLLLFVFVVVNGLAKSVEAEAEAEVVTFVVDDDVDDGLSNLYCMIDFQNTIQKWNDKKVK